jgi:hypothetical protein
MGKPRLALLHIRRIDLKLQNSIKLIMNTYFPEPSSVLASMFFHFEPDNDYAIRCIYIDKGRGETSHSNGHREK